MKQILNHVQNLVGKNKIVHIEKKKESLGISFYLIIVLEQETKTVYEYELLINEENGKMGSLINKRELGNVDFISNLFSKILKGLKNVAG